MLTVTADAGDTIISLLVGFFGFSSDGTWGFRAGARLTLGIQRWSC